MRTVTRRLGKAAAALVLAAAGYALIAPDRAATAQPAAPQWMRSSSPLSPAAAAGTPLPPAPGAVIPASAVLPVAPQPPVPALPVLPNTPPVPPPAPPMALDFKAPAAPKLPAAPVLPLTPPAPPAKSAPAAQSPAPAKADSPLRPADVGNSVKSDASWKAAPAVAPTPRVVDRPKPPEVPVAPSERDVFALPKPPAPAPAVPAAPVAGPIVPPVALPVPPAVPVPPPSVPAVPVATTPGADTMTFKSTAAAAILGGALMAPSAGAQDGLKDKDAPTKATDQKLADIQKSIDGITEMLKGRKDATGVVLPSDVGLLEEVKRLRDDVALLKTQMDAMKSTSLRPPAGAAAPGIPGVPTPMPGANPPAGAAQGTVRVVNEYPVEITMVVNGRTYRVAPNASQDISVTAGEFSYQLLSATAAAAPTRSTIRGGETVTLRIK
jgi:hypothetical protein